MNPCKQSALALLVTAALMGCQSYDAYTGDQKVNNATKLGGIGAVLCGAIGSRESSERAAKYALACGGIGAGVGAYMDQQERILRDELVGSGVQVQRHGNDIILVMPNKITFDSNQSLLKSSAYSRLNSVAKVMKKFDQTLLEIAGHTDSQGKASYNQSLSEKRANSVAVYLRGQGLAPARVRTLGYGESAPIASNETASGRAQNRRVELVIRPAQAQ